MIYLDYAATTPLDPAVLQAMLPHLSGDGTFANPASSHGPGYKARAAVENAASTAAMILTTETLVTEVKEEPAAGGHDHDHHH